MGYLGISPPRNCCHTHRPFPPTLPRYKVSPDPSFGRSSFKGQMCLPGYKIVEHTRYMLEVEILLTGGEEKQLDMCMAMNTTKKTK